MENNNNRVNAPANQDSETDFATLMARLDQSSAIRVAALAAVRDGVITGEGATTVGRVHFSRCLDRADTAIIHRILAADASAVTRAEADALFDIHDAAVERIDDGAFDALFAKAIAHHVLASAGRPVPSRGTALAPETALVDWADLGAMRLDAEATTWLKSRLNRKPRYEGLIAALASAIGIAAALSGSIAAAMDLMS